MKKAYLHIGVEKTGTTTIQSFLAKNREALRVEGYLYPIAPGPVNHVGLTIFAANNQTVVVDLLRSVGLTAGDDLTAYRSKMMADLEDSARRSDCHTLIFSNEHLSSRIRNEDSLELLRNGLLGIVDEVTVGIYLFKTAR